MMTPDEFERAVIALVDRLGMSPPLREAAVQMAMSLPPTQATLDEIERGWRHQRAELRGENN